MIHDIADLYFFICACQSDSTLLDGKNAKTIILIANADNAIMQHWDPNYDGLVVVLDHWPSTCELQGVEIINSKMLRILWYIVLTPRIL